MVYRRISHELKLINMAGETYFRVYTDPNNILNVHFTFLGPSDSPFSKGLYHGVIHLPQDYPHKPPEIVFSTNSGRFETNRYICTSFTSFHPESWNPTWGIRNIIIGLRSLFDEETPGSIGSIVASPEVREKYALESHSFVCRICGCSHADLVPLLHESTISKQDIADDANQITLSSDNTLVSNTLVSVSVPGSNDIVQEVCNDLQGSETVEKVHKDDINVVDVLVDTEPNEFEQKQMAEIQPLIMIKEDLRDEPTNPDTDVEHSTTLQDTPSAGTELQTEPFNIDGSNNASKTPSEQGSVGFSNLALAAISRSLLHAAQNMNSEGFQADELRSLDFLAHLVAGASIPSSVINLISHLRENAQSIRAGVQPHNN